MSSFLCQELSASSCECDTSSGSRRSRRSTSHRSGRRRSSHNNNNNITTNTAANHNNASNTKVQCHSGRDSPASPGLSEAYRGLMLGLAVGGAARTPSLEQQSSCCLTETTDCPSDASVITSISTLHNNGGGRRPTAISPSASTTSSSVSSASCSKERSRNGGGEASSRHLLGSRSQQDFRLAAAYSRSEEDLIQRVPDSLGGAHSAVGDAGMGRVSLPAAALRNLVRERLREEGISLSSHPYTQSVGLQPFSLAMLRTSFRWTWWPL
jgi:hypothetical protein